MNPLWQINTIYTGESSEGTLHAPLEAIGRLEGFSVTKHPTNTAWVRDGAYPIEPNRWILPKFITMDEFIDITQDALEICSLENWEEFLGDPLEPGTYAAYEMGLDYTRIDHKTSELYFQGGNIMKAERKDGRKCHLVGAYNVVASHLLLKEPIEKVKELFQKTFDGNALFVASGRMEQLDYHQDLVLLPLMGGKVLIQDYDESARLLESLIANPEVTQEEREQFTGYLAEARMKADTTRDKVQRLKEELLKENFEPISVSGYYRREGVRKINFINGIHGYAKANNAFMITFGYETPGEKHLQDHFTKVLQEHGVQRAYYVTSPLASTMLEEGGGLRCDTLDI